MPNPDLPAEAKEPSYSGHRQRLRQRLFSAGPESMHDYELLELILFPIIPRRDVKPLAKKLLLEFKGLWGVVNAKPEQLIACGLSETGASSVSVIGAIVLRSLKYQITDRPLLGNWQQIIDYCRLAMGAETKEQLRLLFLDRKNNLLKDEVHQRGTIDHTPAYPREIVQRALEVGAGAIVMVHNHPSGDPAPSKADIDMTHAVAEACRALGIALHDHIIVAKNGKIASFKTLGLL